MKNNACLNKNILVKIIKILKVMYTHNTILHTSNIVFIHVLYLRHHACQR